MTFRTDPKDLAHPSAAREQRPQDLGDALRELRALVGRHGAGLGAPYLARIEENQILAQGSVVPLLGLRWQELRSGLLVPPRAAGAPDPIDQMKAYLTGEEIFGFPVDGVWIQGQLERLPIEEVLIYAASLLNRLRGPGADHSALDREFVTDYLRGEPQTRALNLLRDPHRVLLIPQTFYVLAKLACGVCPEALSADVERGNLVALTIGLADHLGSRAASVREGDGSETVVITGTAGPVGREIIANQSFNVHGSEMALVARSARLWHELAEQFSAHPRVVPLTALFAEATGVAYEDLVTVGAGLWAAAVSGTSLVTPSWFDTLGWSEERVAGALRLISVPIDELRVRVLAEADQMGWEWAISTFERFPVVRLNDDRLLLMDAHLLMARVFGDLPIYDIQAGLTPLAERGKAAARRAKQCFEFLSERHVVELLSAVVANRPCGVRRVYDDTALRTAYGTRGLKVADAAIDYGDAWVLVEVTASKLRREAVAAAPDERALTGDLDKLTDKAAQLHATIGALRTSEQSLTGVEPVATRRFYPVLVMASGFPVNPITMTLVRERLEHAGLLQEHDVEPLEILEPEDLEFMEGVQERSGHTLRSLLAGKAASSLRNMPMRDYLYWVLREPLTYSTRMKASFDVAMAPALAAFRPPEAA